MPDVQADADPVPLSFPAILRNPKLSDRFAHLHISPQDTESHEHRARKDRPEPPEGKRWVRRRENARFTHNPHVVLPTSADLALPLQVPLATFPHPLPSYLPRSLLLPPSRPPQTLPSTSGLFSLSLRGARRTLRARPCAAQLVRAIESHLTAWLQGGTYLNPDQARGLLHFPGDPVGGREDIREVGREAGRLVWAVKPAPVHTDGGFERYVVHCVARWYGVVSFSKETDGHRLTYLLRPDITRPDFHATATSQTLDTPPVTDVSDATLSDFNTPDGSDYNHTDASDTDSVPGDPPIGTRSLSDIEESRATSPASWSVLGGSDFAIDSENDMDDPGFAASTESLSPSPHAGLEGDLATPSAGDAMLLPSVVATRARSLLDAAVALEGRRENPTPSRARADRDRLRTSYPRSASSPSPARRSPRRLPAARKPGARRRKAKNDKKVLAGAVGANKGSFYDYLFA